MKSTVSQYLLNCSFVFAYLGDALHICWKVRHRLVNFPQKNHVFSPDNLHAHIYVPVLLAHDDAIDAVV